MNLKEINTEHAIRLYKRFITENKSKHKLIMFYVQDMLDNKLNELSYNFPPASLHAIAVKTNANHKVLNHIARRGFGLEAASLEEVILAKKAGTPNHRIVFDSPVKTYEEISYCHKNLPGIIVNSNSIAELERYPDDFSGKSGLRINPMIKTDAPGFFNLSDIESKFGVPLIYEKEIIDALIRNSSVSILHMHIGSNIKNFNNNIKAIKKTYELAEKINSERRKRNIKNPIETIDIGGGIDFSPDNDSFSVRSFTEKLKNIPGLIENYNIITEYGKYIHRKNSFLVSDIEYVIKNTEEVSTAYIHAGADLFLRKVYSNLPIKYRYDIIYNNKLKNRKQKTYNIAGPLCFEGDFLFRKINLNEITTEDKFIIFDTGANTNSMWSRHCNREEPVFVFSEL